MSTGTDQPDQDPTDAEVVGVPPDTKPEVEPSATGVVVGPLDEPRATEVAEVRGDDPDAPER